MKESNDTKYNIPATTLPGSLSCSSSSCCSAGAASPAAATAAAAALVVSGCGGSKKEEASGSSDVVWYMPKTVSNLSHQAMVEEAANKLISEKLDARLKFKLIDSSMYDQKMNVIVSSGESYDICFTTSWTNNYFKNVKQNAFLDISGLLD